MPSPRCERASADRRRRGGRRRARAPPPPAAPAGSRRARAGSSGSSGQLAPAATGDRVQVLDPAVGREEVERRRAPVVRAPRRHDPSTVVGPRRKLDAPYSGVPDELTPFLPASRRRATSSASRARPRRAAHRRPRATDRDDARRPPTAAPGTTAPVARARDDHRPQRARAAAARPSRACSGPAGPSRASRPRRDDRRRERAAGCRRRRAREGERRSTASTTRTCMLGLRSGSNGSTTT